MCVRSARKQIKFQIQIAVGKRKFANPLTGKKRRENAVVLFVANMGRCWQTQPPKGDELHSEMWYMHVAIFMSESEAEERARSDKKLNDRFELDMRIAEEESMMDMELQPPSHESVLHTPSWLLAFTRSVYSEGMLREKEASKVWSALPRELMVMICASQMKDPSLFGSIVVDARIHLKKLQALTVLQYMMKYCCAGARYVVCEDTYVCRPGRVPAGCVKMGYAA